MRDITNAIIMSLCIRVIFVNSYKPYVLYVCDHECSVNQMQILFMHLTNQNFSMQLRICESTFPFRTKKYNMKYVYAIAYLNPV